VAVRKFPLRRGIEPAALLAWTRNTASWALQRPEPFLVRLASYAGEELSHLEYFHLCLCAHWATCGTFVPTDVDNAIRLKLWQMPESEGHREAMAELTLAALKWDYRPVTAKIVAAPSGGLLSTHEGTWFSVAVGAYAALRGTPKADEVYAAIRAEAEREDRVFAEIVDAGDGLDILRACALLAHNFGDLDRVMDMWNLTQSDALRESLYDAAKPGSKLFGGRLGWAGALNQKFMAPENHRYLALREPRFLRTSGDLLLPIGPFLDAWGGRMAGEPGEHVGELVRALLDGIEWTPGSAAYARALAGILEAFPGGMKKLCAFIPGRDQRLLSAGAVRAQLSIPRERFEAQWARFYRQMPRP
jgi:hypothetical protein